MVAAEAVVPVAVDLAARIAASAPLAVRFTKQSLYDVAGSYDAERWRQAQAAAEPLLNSEDAREGARAVAEKRPPRWTGR